MILKLFLSLITLLLSVTVLSAQIAPLDSLSHDGLQRKYALYTPPGATGELPLVVVLHGGSGNATSVQGFTRMNLVADANDFHVLYPEGGATTPIGGFAWADGRGTTADDAGIDDVDFVNVLIDSIVASHSVDTQRIYLTGFSNGGFLAQKIACEQNDKFAAISALGATQNIPLNNACAPGRAIPMIMMHGTADSSVPNEGGNMANVPDDVIGAMALMAFWQQNNNCSSSLDSTALPDVVTDDNSTAVQFDYTDCDCGADVRHFRLNDAGHTWPGVELPQLEPVAGETNEDINASSELWNFFSQHTLDCPITSRAEAFAPSTQVNPNPSTGSFTISNPEPIEQIKLRNLTGKTVYEATPNARQLRVQLEGIAPGLYVLEMRTNSNRYLSTRRVVITGH